MNRKEKSLINKEIRNLKIQERRNEKKEIIDKKWILIILLLSFTISFTLSFISELTLPNVNIILGIILVILFVMLGVLFDMIGVAVTVANEKIFHSMNSRKVKGADIAILFKKNSDKVASFCNDVIGDISGVITGAAGITIAIKISNALDINVFVVTLITTAIVASLTITGKALGKSYAINKSDLILFKFSKFISNFYKIK